MKEGLGEPVKKPASIHAYNHSMNGCDRMDQMLSYYGCHNRKTIKWWRKIFTWMLELTQCNTHSHTFYLTSPERKCMPLKDFKVLFIKQLQALATVENPVMSPRPGRRSSTSMACERLAAGPHLPRRHPEGKSLTCVLCAKRGIRSRTFFYCSQCSDKPHLCISTIDCYYLYHTLRDL